MKVLLFMVLSGFATEPGHTNRDASTLEPTQYIDSNHPDIVSTTVHVVRGLTSPREKAVALHNFVRDEVSFGFGSNFYDSKASEVLRARIGFCTTKTTLFVAMLRAADIPARQHFVSINADILRGFLDPGRPYVDHAFAEVFLDGKWLSVDSYIVDLPLAVKAKSRLKETGESLGFGVHRNGVSDWNGRQDAFSQFLDDGAATRLTTEDFGIHRDVGAFYASGKGLNQLNFLVRPFFGFLIGGTNDKIAKLRSDT